MAYAVSLLFNPEITDAISARWMRLADAGISRSMLNFGYPPHLTLAVYDTLAADMAAVALDQVFNNIGQTAVTLTGFATFGTGSGVCYAALAPSPELVRLHAAAVDAVGEICRPHYQPGRWTPHCTLAVGVSDPDMNRAKVLLEKDWRSLTGVFEQASLVEFAPVIGIKIWRLAPVPHAVRTP
jgi:2'-5' RNA ligase